MCLSKATIFGVEREILLNWDISNSHKRIYFNECFRNSWMFEFPCSRWQILNLQYYHKIGKNIGGEGKTLITKTIENDVNQRRRNHSPKNHDCEHGMLIQTRKRPTHFMERRNGNFGKLLSKSTASSKKKKGFHTNGCIRFVFNSHTHDYIRSMSLVVFSGYCWLKSFNMFFLFYTQKMWLEWIQFICWEWFRFYIHMFL